MKATFCILFGHHGKVLLLNWAEEGIFLHTREDRTRQTFLPKSGKVLLLFATSTTVAKFALPYRKIVLRFRKVQWNEIACSKSFNPIYAKISPLNVLNFSTWPPKPSHIPSPYPPSHLFFPPVLNP